LFLVTLQFVTLSHKFGQAIRPTQGPLRDNTQHLQHNPSVSPAGFETAFQAGERPQTHAIDRAATEIGTVSLYRTGQTLRAPGG